MERSSGLTLPEGRCAASFDGSTGRFVWPWTVLARDCL